MGISEETPDRIKRTLFKKLYLRVCWGKGHISESNLIKGFPPHLKGFVKEVAEKLRKEGFLVARPSGHEYQWYLNPAKREEIEKIVRGGRG